MADAVAAVERVVGGSGSARRRLERAGLDPDVDAFRAEQVVWAVVCGCAATVVAGLLWSRGSLGPAAAAVLVVLAAAGRGAGAATRC